MIDLLITDAQVYDDGRLVRGHVAVDDGRVMSVHADASALHARSVLRADGGLLLPGAVDLHVHFRDPGFPEREDFTSGSAAAALGGVTTVVDMPNTRPAVLTADVLEAKRRHIEGRSYVDFALFGGVDGSNIDQVDDLTTVGAAAFKTFMYARRDAPPAGVTDDAVLLAVMTAVARTGRRLHVHAENDDLVRAGRAAAQASGRSDWSVHEVSRGWLVEAEAVGRAVLLARAAGTPLHVCHLSSAAGLAAVLAAKNAGDPVTTEVTPQHLLLDDRRYDELGADLVMVPPVRSSADRAALAHGLADGSVDVVATDHAPHTDAAKHGHPLEIATGLVGVQWSYPLVLGEVTAGRLSLARAVDALATRPAELVGLGHRKGRILPGFDADLVVLAPEAATLLSSDLASRGRSTPFSGRSVPHPVRSSVVGGRVQVADGRLVGACTGSFVRPHNPEGHLHA